MFTFSFSLVPCSLLKVLDSRIVQEISMVNGSTSKVLQACVQYIRKKNSSYSHLFPSYPQNKRYK